ncbi:PAS domain-containing sensor histidine kinase [Denitromonas iodatirespirans]|uniref:histidine kinase n=1 Tax=Denitromonas iodatirespirans TaxID=2795389 RepID=A0A944DK68_DENI1|nr:PAS domain-containing sensor histidine kinase [Denitromonas iodatirespirans]MBT0960289.1 HAMP domain-containing protein [Denitromonas iodatirespirans]
MPTWPRLGGLTRRIYLAFLVAAVLPTAVAGIIGVYFSVDALRGETLAGLKQEVSLRGEGIDSFLQQISAQLLALSSAPELDAFRDAIGSDNETSARASTEVALARLSGIYQYLYQIRYLSAEGQEQVRVDRIDGQVRVTPPDRLQDKSDRYYVRDALTTPPGRIYISPLDLNVEFGHTETPERPVIRLGTVVPGTATRAPGLLIVNLHADVLLGQIQQMADARRGTAFLFDRAGHYLARAAGEASQGMRMRPVADLAAQFDAALVERMLAAQRITTLAAGEWILAVAPVGAAGDASQWAVALAFPERSLFERVLNLYLLYAVLLLALAVTAIGGFVISRRLLGPMDALSQETEAIAAGDFSRRVTIPGNDEISALGARFNAMAARLQRLYDSLERQRDGLEREVKARTRDLEQERAFLATLIQHLGDGVLAVDRSGRLRLANAQAVKLLRVDAPRAAEHPAFADVWPPWTALAARATEALEAGRGWREDVVAPGQVLAMTVTAYAEGVLLVVRDVSVERQLADERRELDRHMFQMEKLISFGELSMGLAHEIGNPLAGMKAVAQALLYEEDLPTGVPEALSRLEAEIDRLAGFLKSFRGFAAAPVPVTRACALAEVVEDVCFWVRKEARSAGVRVEWLGLDTAPPVQADPQQLKQLLLNLFINALHAMPEGGTLRITADDVADGMLHFHVSDTGVGMPSEIVNQVFEPFFTTRETGTGLGLSIVRKITQVHGALVHIDSAPGHGTTFHLTWPLSETP